MQFEALSQFDNNEGRVEFFDRIVRAGPWQLATLDGLLARDPIPFSAVLVHDRGAALDLTFERIAREAKPIAVIGYSETVRADRIVDALHAGAIDYIAWPPDPATFADRLQIAARRADRRRTVRASRSAFESLSRRELEVLEALSNGETIKGTARRLGLSPRTVEVHRANVLNKVGAGSALQAAVLAVKANLF
jgi:two-component system response regulator FixJ